MKITLIIFVLIGACYAASKYTEISPSNYHKDPSIAVLRNFGTDFVLDEALADGRISRTDFELNEVHHIYRKHPTSSLFFYKYELSVISELGRVVDMTFEVRYNKKTHAKQMIDFDYEVIDEELVRVLAVEEHEPVLADEDHESVPADEEHEPVLADEVSESEPEPETERLLANAPIWSAIPTPELLSKPIKRLLKWARTLVIDEAISEGELPSGTYESKRIIKAERLVGSDRTDYKFRIVCENSLNANRVEMNLFIRQNLVTGQKTIMSSSLSILDN
jgi:hypothetical protein